MTKEEIQEAIERHQNGGVATSAAPTAASQPVMQPMQQQLANTAPMMMTAAAPMQMVQRQARYPPYVRVLWTLSSLVGAASILTFLWNYAVQSGYIPWLVQEEKEQEAMKDEALLAELTSVSSAIQKQTAELAKLSTSLDEKERDMQNKTLLTAQISSSLAEQSNAQSIAELKAEISTLKALLLSKRSESTANSDVNESVKESDENTKTQSALLSGSKPIISTSAAVSPKQTTATVPKAVSKAEPSKTTGAFDENIAILRALLKALQSLTNPKSSSNLSLEEIAHASLEEFFTQQSKKKLDGASSTTTSVTTTTTTTEKSTVSSLDAFMARLEQQSSVSNISSGDNNAAKVLSQNTSATEADEEEKMPVPVAKPISPTVTAGGPSYPESFKEVMDLIQKGEPVPGIRDIEEKLSVDSSALLSQQMQASEAAAAKPWEKVKA
ncbi:unnamed protein product [Phytophthora fragariaefolia]|uniref:Unnamed protein product n=1 Tax=Phytophthora fragariaefolia TaxID=1490495 RepID=A0A9W7CYM8_9STRA|nr:unnamed protein product [Phytophthora fragariaefolia]